MATYRYRAKNLASQTVTGTFEAPDVNTLRKHLREQDQFLISSREVDVQKTVYKMKDMELSDFSREIYSMQDAGITVIRALGIMRERNIKPKVKTVYENLYRSVQQGSPCPGRWNRPRVLFPCSLSTCSGPGRNPGRWRKQP